ncbi:MULTISPECIES: recombinase family protein [Serratia]|uniref:recombinase family protein n=1 Tax=Serratia TaxID=613 RepID=UPI001AEB518B|nr:MULTISPECIES: recombinase family protein [Serratia]MBP1130424.1 DNA invertase Pin-like site-specific DNA recombinase [Serratia sp. PL17]MDU4176803.1 recombinase family protein [Serratia liquefaciens]
MANSKFITYYRVSTTQQGKSGLGLEAQRAAVKLYLKGGDGSVVSEFEEVETGKGSNALDKRPQLRAALAACKKYGATLLIAKLDRLARNVHFVSGLLETGIDFVAADMPQANKVMIQMHAVMSEWERDQISSRTKAALAVAKEQGKVLGAAGSVNLKSNTEARRQVAQTFAENLRPLIESWKDRGLSQRRMVEVLNMARTPAPKGGEWRLSQLQRVISRLDL